ncbi:MAG TPA: DUF2723 domain-containing protein [Kofleriaceae bacterium]|jgi:hypothetical protein|nr:DUF2723 domain-containing protein [Kofleriaceae bacterium]
MTGRWRSWLRSIAVARGGLVALAALIAYLGFASPRVVDADNSEFALLGAIGGRAHPSGYPLYVVWLRLWSWLPGATPAHTAALATAVLGGLTILVLHAACRAWGARPAAATITAATFAAAPVVVRYACEAEVFTLNDLIAALVVWLAAGAGPLRGRWRGAALGLVAGLGLANHLTCALVAPVGVLGVVRAVRESRATTWAIAVAGLVLGLSPYAYLVVADGPASWGRVASASDLLDFVLRRDYGTTSLSRAGGHVPWSTSLAAWAVTVGRTWLWLPAAGGVAMLAVRIWRPAGESRRAWALLAASFALAGPLLAMRFNIDPHGVGRQICERFHLLPALLLAVPVAALIDLAGERLSRPALVTAAAVLGFAALALAGWPRLARIHSPAMELGVQNLLRSLPRDAIAVVIADDHCSGGRYLQLARGERPDVALVCAGLLPLTEYRAGWERRGLVLPGNDSARLGEALLASGRPVLVDPFLHGVLAAFPAYPFGVLRRVLPRGAALPSPADVAAINHDVYRAFDLDDPRPDRDDDYPALVHLRYASTWALIARALDAAGDRDGGRDARDLAHQLLPTGEPDRDAAPVDLPIDLAPLRRRDRRP